MKIKLIVALALIFIAAMVFMGWRDHRAVERCHDLGGQTWDAGQHCAIGVDHVIDTHDRIWG